MTLKDCMLSRVVSGVRVGCDGRTCPAEECERCGWNKEEDARRRKLPLTASEDGLYSRKPKPPEPPRHKPEPARLTPEPPKRGCKRAVIYTDPETGVETEYESVKEAAEAASMSDVGMHHWLSGRSNVREAYNWRYATDPPRRPPERASTHRCRRKVIYTDPETGEEQVYRTAREAARAAGISGCTMSNWLLGRRKKRGKPAAQCWRYADE